MGRRGPDYTNPKLWGMCNYLAFINLNLFLMERIKNATGLGKLENATGGRSK